MIPIYNIVSILFLDVLMNLFLIRIHCMHGSYCIGLGTYDFLLKGATGTEAEGEADGIMRGDLETDEPWGHLPSRAEDGESPSQSRSGLKVPDLEKQLIPVVKDSSGMESRPNAREVIETGK